MKIFKEIVGGTVVAIILVAISAKTITIIPEISAIDKESHVLDVLAICESGNNPDVINPKDGGSASYGLLQWKEESFFAYNERYRVLPDLERAEVLNIIMEPFAQRALAKKVLQEPNGWRNWFNCLKDRY